MRLYSMLVPLIAAFGVSCSKPSQVAMPRVEITPRDLDLGRMKIGADASQHGEFRLRNRGTGTLAILGRKVSCGCTVPDWPPATIAPGAEVVVRLSVNAQNDPGAHSSVISFTTNDPATPEVRVMVRWLEHAAISIEPKSIDLGWVNSESATEARATVQISSSLGNDPLAVSSNNDEVEASWAESAPIRSDSSFDRVLPLKIRLPSGRKPGNGSAAVRITSRDEKYLAYLPITWRSGSEIEISPKVFFHSGVSPLSKVTNRVILRFANGSPVDVRSLEIDGQPAQIFSMPTNAGTTASALTFAFIIEAGESRGIEQHIARLSITGNTKPIEIPVTIVVK